MASSAKKKTTFAKLERERKLRERRMDKQARKAARKQAAELGAEANGDAPATDVTAADDVLPRTAEG